ncbi:hypothetical protein D3C72_2284530 [compost metagenome]
MMLSGGSKSSTGLFSSRSLTLMKPGQPSSTRDMPRSMKVWRITEAVALTSSWNSARFSGPERNSSS